jgi:hypothetical protein
MKEKQPSQNSLRFLFTQKTDLKENFLRNKKSIG